jgi:hypothetical protein
MRDLLDRLHKTKLQLLALVSTVTGITLLFLAHWMETITTAAWLTNLPLTDIGSALFTTGLLAVAYEYVNRKDGDERANERLRHVLREEAPTMRKAVIDGFTFSADTLKDVAAPELLDRLITNALALRLDDHTLATDTYTGLRDQLIQAPERWHDVKASVTLSPWDRGPATGDGSMFIATIRWEYRARPATPTLRFACVADLDEHRELLRDPTIVAAWYFGRPTGIDASCPDAFALVQCAVNGIDRPIRRTQRKGSQLYTATLPPTTTGQEVTISCIYQALVQRHGHLLYLDIPRPIKALQVQFWYGNCGIRRINTLDFIASTQQPRILRSPSSVPTPSIEISFDGWIFPKSGVAFVWVLEGEMTTNKTEIATVGGA